MKKKLSIFMMIMMIFLIAFTGCTKLKSTFKDLTAETIGLSRDFYVYDDFGNATMTVSGNSTDMESSEVDNVILITIDGYTWQHVGSSMIAAEKGVKNLVDEYNLETNIDSGKNGTGILMSLDRKINNFKSKMTGLRRVLVIKNQSGVIVGVYEGNKVLVEESSLPQSTKILIDGKRMTIYRCDYEIFEQGMLR